MPFTAGENRNNKKEKRATMGEKCRRRKGIEIL
jgi:hypothetical protein